MSELTLAEAAEYIGVPRGVLQQWAWDDVIHPANNRKWSPTFTKRSLEQWLADHRSAISASLSH